MEYGKHTKGGYVRTRFLVAMLAVVLLSSITTLHVFSASGHGCAPPIPPTVPGSPAPAPAIAGVILLTAHTTIDSGPNTNPYYLPFGTSIAAHGFLVLFPRTSSSFLSTETSTLRLIIGGVTIDQVVVSQLAGDQSYARMPDGGSNWQLTSAPTIDTSNLSSQATPTPSASQGSQGSGGRGGSGSSTPSGSRTKTLINGTQPPWSNLQLPAAAATPIVNSPATTLSSSPTTGGDPLDLPRRIALTLLAIALALTLFWCWRLFTPTPP